SRFPYSSAPALSSRCHSSYSNSKSTHFGYQTVSEEQKKHKVLGVFHNVADSYDLMNDAMSVGVHRLWKDHFMAKLNPGPHMKLLDVAGGTGDVAFRFLSFPTTPKLGQNRAKSPEETADEDQRHVVCCDINPSMLAVGRERALNLGLEPQRLSWVEGDAQKLPFESESFDAYTIAFGIRNVVRIEEFSHVANPVLGPLYDLYSFQVIPPMGKVLAGDWDSYQYLVESIRKFPDQETFKNMIESTGFRCVSYENLTMGVSAIHSGFKL
ncbi:hypothetical protein TCAL_01175, partial [Tigriopus californicus]